MEGGAGMRLSLVIPAYNESSIMRDTLTAVTAALTAVDSDYELIVVDDGSSDDTAALVRAFPDPHVRLESYQPNRGKGCAVRTGMLSARGDYVFYTDADLAYGLDDISPMLEKFSATGADLVIGSRRLEEGGYQNYPPLRLIASKCFHLLVRLLSGLSYDTQCGIKGFTRSAAQAVFSRCTADGFAFDFEVLLWANKLGLRVEQQAVRVVNHRESKVNVLRDSLRMFRDILAIRGRVAKG